MTTLNELNAIQLTEDIETRLFLWLFFSRKKLIKYRVLVEIEYFIALCEGLCHNCGVSQFDILRNIYKISLLKMRLDQRNRESNQPRKSRRYLSRMPLKN
jgi:hypothetical protein